MNSDVYLIWSNEHLGWWKPGKNGYTRDLSKAGHYSYHQAIEICRAAIMTAPHLGMIAELPVRFTDVGAFLKGQHVPRAIIR